MALKVKPRNVSLTLENDAFIVALVASGRFGSASEVVRAALRLLQDRERDQDASAKPAARGRKIAALTTPAGN